MKQRKRLTKSQRRRVNQANGRLGGRPKLTATERALRAAKPADRTPDRSPFGNGYNPATAPVRLRRHPECSLWCCTLAVLTCPADCPTKRELCAAGQDAAIPTGPGVGSAKEAADRAYTAAVAVWRDTGRVVELPDGRLVPSLRRPGGRAPELPEQCPGSGDCALDDAPCDGACGRLRAAHNDNPREWPLDENTLAEFAHERRLRREGFHP